MRELGALEKLGKPAWSVQPSDIGVPLPPIYVESILPPAKGGSWWVALDEPTFYATVRKLFRGFESTAEERERFYDEQSTR